MQESLYHISLYKLFLVKGPGLKVSPAVASHSGLLRSLCPQAAVVRVKCCRMTGYDNISSDSLFVFGFSGWRQQHLISKHLQLRNENQCIPDVNENQAVD